MPYPAAFVLALLLALGHPAAAAGGFTLTDGEDHEIHVQVIPADGNLLLIWPVEVEPDRPGLLRTLEHLQQAGIEVWLANPLEDYFLARTSENERTLTGAPVAALIEAAHARSGKPILLIGHDRMALALLRGLRAWQGSRPGEPRLAGAVLLYPNLFGPAPAAGEEPGLDPLVSATNWPLLVLQPERGSLVRRMGPVIEALWAAGAPAYVLTVPGVRDWYPFHTPGRDPAEAPAVAALPGQLRLAARVLAAAPRPAALTPLPADAQAGARAIGLIALDPPPPAPPLVLADAQGHLARLDERRSAITLVNFWASWCPPCVEEIPSMNRLAARYDPADFAIVSVNFQESAEEMRAFMRQVEVDFPVLLDSDGAVSHAWGVFAFPSSFLVDRNGRVRYSVNSAIEWDEEAVIVLIDRLLAERSDSMVGPAAK
jgi:thiol-disulfide isomerase/thioredoxin